MKNFVIFDQFGIISFIFVSYNDVIYLMVQIGDDNMQQIFCFRLQTVVAWSDPLQHSEEFIEM